MRSGLWFLFTIKCFAKDGFFWNEEESGDCEGGIFWFAAAATTGVEIPPKEGSNLEDSESESAPNCNLAYSIVLQKVKDIKQEQINSNKKRDEKNEWLF